jgi:23S rRNA (guanosine2251-2'-O)-methyltransferase
MEYLEGRISVLAALAARQRRIDLILLKHGIQSETVRPIVELAEQLGVPTRYAEAQELDNLAHGSTHGGVLAVAGPRPRTTPAELLALVDKLKTPPLMLLLEGIDDARNLGFVIRTAEAMALHAVLVKKHLWDFDPVEVARPASGAYERMPLVQIEDIGPLTNLRKRGIALVGCVGSAKRSIDQLELTRPTVLVIGGEKRGLSGAVRAICDEFASIPSAPGGVTLSLSHAAAIVMYEAFRQRRRQDDRGAGASAPL